MIARRTVGGLMVLLLIIIFCPLYGEAENKKAVEWEIKVYDNHTINETVTIFNNEISTNTSDWKKTISGDTTILTRTVDDWAAYNALADKLPIEAQIRSFVFWHKNSLGVTGDGAPAGSVFSQIKNLPGISIIISVPGYITDSSGDRISEMSTAWEFDNIEALNEGEVMLQAVTFEGFLIGIAVFLLGLLIIGVVYIRRMKQVDRMMEAEYSLENIEIDPALRAENQEKEEEEGSWF